MRARHALSIVGLSVIGASAAMSATYSDDFSDNAIGPRWTLVYDHGDVVPLPLNLNETNQQLQAVANNPADSHTDALYLSNGTSGFRLPTSGSFDITISYKFIPPSTASTPGDAMALDLGVGTAVDGHNSVAIGFGYTYETFAGVGIMVPGLAAASRINNVETDTGAPESTADATGILEVNYNAATDVFTLSNAHDTETRSGLVAAWGNPGSLLVSFGVRGSGFTFDGSSVYLDNFSAVTPEPSVWPLLTMAALGLLARRRFASDIKSITPAA